MYLKWLEIAVLCSACALLFSWQLSYLPLRGSIIIYLLCSGRAVLRRRERLLAHSMLKDPGWPSIIEGELNIEAIKSSHHEPYPRTIWRTPPTSFITLSLASLLYRFAQFSLSSSSTANTSRSLLNCKCLHPRSLRRVAILNISLASTIHERSGINDTPASTTREHSDVDNTSPPALFVLSKNHQYGIHSIDFTDDSIWIFRVRWWHYHSNYGTRCLHVLSRRRFEDM